MTQTQLTDDERFFLCVLLSSELAAETDSAAKSNIANLLRKLNGVDKRVIVQEG